MPRRARGPLRSCAASASRRARVSVRRTFRRPSVRPPCASTFIRSFPPIGLVANRLRQCRAALHPAVVWRHRPASPRRRGRLHSRRRPENLLAQSAAAARRSSVARPLRPMPPEGRAAPSIAVIPRPAGQTRAGRIALRSVRPRARFAPSPGGQRGAAVTTCPSSKVGFRSDEWGVNTLPHEVVWKIYRSFFSA